MPGAREGRVEGLRWAVRIAARLVGVAIGSARLMLELVVEAHPVHALEDVVAIGVNPDQTAAGHSDRQVGNLPWWP
jgi:hypothetical protein